MMPGIALVICLVVGAAIGSLAVFARVRPQLAARSAEIAALHGRLKEAEAARRSVAELHTQASTLRHDLRGILSPALLTADRLANSQDPAVRKAADIVIRSVERASARLADKTPAQDGAKSDQA